MLKLRLPILSLGLLILSLCPVAAKSFDELFPLLAEDKDAAWVKDLQRLDYKQGLITIGDGVATLSVEPDRFYFFNPSDARVVLEEFWENPPNPATLGMIFPIHSTPYHSDSWAVEITFEEIGYVKDEDAESYDYGDLLREMQRDTREASKWRVENGYQAIELVGWAAEPSYDKAGRKLHWAKELAFEGDELNTLNYNIRALGRRGVLVMNFIAGMDQMDEINAAVPEILAMVNFADGHKYSDFDPSLDTVAAVGIGGLIAGKALTKTGFLAVALIFLKKFWFVLLFPLAYVGRLFGRGKGQS